jgi:hypothetical protein
VAECIPESNVCRVSRDESHDAEDEEAIGLFVKEALKSGLHESLNVLEAGKLQFTLLMTEITAEGAAVETASLT